MEVVFFFRQEFTKTRSNIESMIEREDLLSSVHKEIDNYGKAIFLYFSLLLDVPASLEKTLLCMLHMQSFH